MTDDITLDAFFRSDAQRAAKQKEAKERELEHAAFSADRIEEGGFPPVSMVSRLLLHKKNSRNSEGQNFYFVAFLAFPKLIRKRESYTRRLFPCF